MNHNNHIKTYLRLMNERMHDLLLENTEKMNDTCYSGWRTRRDEVTKLILTAQMLRKTLQQDAAVQA